MTGSAQAIPQTTSRRGLDWDVMWERYGISAVLVVVWAIAALTLPNFASRDNLLNVLRQSSFVGVAAVGMTVAIIAGTFDLSVGSTLGLAAWVAVAVAARWGVLAAMLAGVATGTVVGSINGLLVSRVRIPAFITTLGMLFIVRGFHYVITNGDSARFNGKSFIWLGNGTIAGLPVPFWIFLLCAALAAAVLAYTSFGRYVYAVGSNSEAALVAGVPLRRITALVFVVIGAFTGLAGVLIGARLYSAAPGLEPGFELNVIATVVLGGTRLAGGRGSMLGTMAAASLFVTLTNILNLAHADPFMQKVAVGLVLLVALSIEGIRQRLAERLARS